MSLRDLGKAQRLQVKSTVRAKAGKAAKAKYLTEISGDFFLGKLHNYYKFPPICED